MTDGLARVRYLATAAMATHTPGAVGWRSVLRGLAMSLVASTVGSDVGAVALGPHSQHAPAHAAHARVLPANVSDMVF